MSSLKWAGWREINTTSRITDPASDFQDRKNVQLTSIYFDSESERWHHDSLQRLRSHNSCSRHSNVNVLFWVFAETAFLFFILQKKNQKCSRLKWYNFVWIKSSKRWRLNPKTITRQQIWPDVWRHLLRLCFVCFFTLLIIRHIGSDVTATAVRRELEDLLLLMSERRTPEGSWQNTEDVQEALHLHPPCIKKRIYIRLHPLISTLQFRGRLCLGLRLRDGKSLQLEHVQQAGKWIIAGEVLLDLHKTETATMNMWMFDDSRTALTTQSKNQDEVCVVSSGRYCSDSSQEVRGQSKDSPSDWTFGFLPFSLFLPARRRPTHRCQHEVKVRERR